MNEIFEFRKELNIKRILIVILIILIIIGVIGFIVWKALPPSEKNVFENRKNENTNSVFQSENKNISLTLSSSYNFIQYKSNSDYVLELRNENNLNIFITEENSLENLVFSELVEADLKSYVSQFNNFSNVSNISEIDRGGNPAYTYSFHYLDSNTKTAYYLQSIWIEYNNKYYILDIEFPLNSLSENSKIINDVLNSIVIK